MVTLVPSFIAWAVAAWATAAPLIAIYAPIAALIAIIGVIAYVVINNWETIKNATKAAWDWVLNAIQSVWNWIKDNWPLLLAIITGPIGLAVKFVVDHWDTIKGAVRVAWDFIVNLMGTLGGYISAPFSAALGVITGVWSWIKSAAQNAYDFIAGVFGTLGDVITAPIKLAWNALASVWNSTVGAISIKVPDFVPGIGGKGFDVPDLPRLAKGGVLTSPTLFLGGEAGTEIVAPEPMLREIMREEGAGSSYTLNIYPRTADASDIAYGFRRLELLAGVA
jgi:phage-related protein